MFDPAAIRAEARAKVKAVDGAGDVAAGGKAPIFTTVIATGERTGTGPVWASARAERASARNADRPRNIGRGSPASANDALNVEWRC